jgi:hypothetical protein
MKVFEHGDVVRVNAEYPFPQFYLHPGVVTAFDGMYYLVGFPNHADNAEGLGPRMSVTHIAQCSYVHEIEQGKDYAYCQKMTAWFQFGVPMCVEHMAVQGWESAA